MSEIDYQLHYTFIYLENNYKWHVRSSFQNSSESCKRDCFRMCSAHSCILHTWRVGRTDVKYQTHNVWMYWYENIGRIQYIFFSFQAKLKRNLNLYVTSNFISLAKPFLNLVPLVAWLEATVFTLPDPVSWKSEWMSIKIATYKENCITEITPTNDRVAVLNSTWQ